MKLKYIDNILLVNKKNRLPSTYNPGINAQALKAFKEMQANALKEGIVLEVVSGYRPYELQKKIYLKNVKLYGEEEANTFSAKPRRI